MDPFRALIEIGLEDEGRLEEAATAAVEEEEPEDVDEKDIWGVAVFFKFRALPLGPRVVPRGGGQTAALSTKNAVHVFSSCCSSSCCVYEI